MKRLRKQIAPQKAKVLYAGEYGGLGGRPHYHLCLFGVGFPDRYHWRTRGSFPVWRSPALEALWPDGQSEIGSLTMESVAYVARYTLKKRTRPGTLKVDAETGECWPVVPEFARMSRGGRDGRGLGYEWLKRHYGEVYHEDCVGMGSRRFRPPRYYDQQLAELDPDLHSTVQECRLFRERDEFVRDPEGACARQSVTALRSRRVMAEQRLQKRSLE